MKLKRTVIELLVKVSIEHEGLTKKELHKLARSCVGRNGMLGTMGNCYYRGHVKSVYVAKK